VEAGHSLPQRRPVLVVQAVDGTHRVPAENPHRRVPYPHPYQPHRRGPPVDVQGGEGDGPRAALAFLRKGDEVERLPVEDEAQPTRQTGSFGRLLRLRQVVEPQVLGGGSEVPVARLAEKPLHGSEGTRAVDVLGDFAQAVVEGTRLPGEKKAAEKRPPGPASQGL